MPASPVCPTPARCSPSSTSSSTTKQASCSASSNSRAAAPSGSKSYTGSVMLSVFCSASRYTQGKNATRFLGREMATLGLAGPVLIVASRSAASLLSDTWSRTLPEAGFSYHVSPFGGECSIAEIERLKAEAGLRQARVIVGAGGGKALDAARAAAADLNLPVVSCPTVASSDAPCSALSIVYTDDGVFLECRIY